MRVHVHTQPCSQTPDPPPVHAAHRLEMQQRGRKHRLRGRMSAKGALMHGQRDEQVSQRKEIK